MRILAVDTTTSRGSVALLDGERRFEVRAEAPRGHSRWVLEAAQTLQDASGLPLVHLDAFAVTTGPGSFTGLRVGLATVQGLAFGASRPVVAVSGLEVLASLPEVAGPIVALVDAWREEVYWAVYESGRVLGPPRAGRPEALLPGLPAGCILVGDGATRHAGTIKALRPDLRTLEVDLFLASPLARLATRALGEGRSIEASALRALYLRGADIRLPQT